MALFPECDELDKSHFPEIFQRTVKCYAPSATDAKVIFSKHEKAAKGQNKRRCALDGFSRF